MSLLELSSPAESREGGRGLCVRERASAITASAVLIAVLSTLVSAGCVGGDAGTPTTPADFAGLWTSTSGFNLLRCSGKPIDQPFEPFTILMNAGSGHDLDLVEVDQTDFVTPVCVYHLTVSGNQASLKGAQTCTLDDGAGGSFTTTYTADSLTLSANAMTLDETSSLDDSDDCHVDATRRYVRGRP
jgi:hypothetical protein